MRLAAFWDRAQARSTAGIWVIDSRIAMRVGMSAQQEFGAFHAVLPRGQH